MPSKSGLDFHSITEKYRYRIGEIARTNEIRESNSHIIHFGYASVLKKGNGAFILRSDKTWRFAIVLERVRGKDPYIDFIVDDIGSIKRITPKHWSTYIREINESNSLETRKKESQHRTPFSHRFIDPELMCEQEEQLNLPVKHSIEELCVSSESAKCHSTIRRNTVNNSRLYTNEEASIDIGDSPYPRLHCYDSRKSSSPSDGNEFSDRQEGKCLFERCASERVVKASSRDARASPLRRAKSKHSSFENVDNIQTLFEQVMIGHEKSKKVKKGCVAKAA